MADIADMEKIYDDLIIINLYICSEHDVRATHAHTLEFSQTKLTV